MQTQVGTADIVDVLSAAPLAHGRLGGLDGARFRLVEDAKCFLLEDKKNTLAWRETLGRDQALTTARPTIRSLENTNEYFSAATYGRS